MFPGRLSLESYLVDHWLPTRRSNLRPSTLARYERETLRHINPFIGHVPLHRVTAADLDALYAALLDRGRQDGNGLAPKTVLNIHQILRAALRDAFNRGLVTHNEALLAHPPRLRHRFSNKPNAWTARQLASFLESCSSHRLWPAIYVAATTGMRRGEVLGLRWGDVDFNRRRLSVHRTIIAIAYDTAESTVKTRTSRRVIDLSPQTLLKCSARGETCSSQMATSSRTAGSCSAAPTAAHCIHIRCRRHSSDSRTAPASQ
jgi:integrase